MRANFSVLVFFVIIDIIISAGSNSGLVFGFPTKYFFLKFEIRTSTSGFVAVSYDFLQWLCQAPFTYSLIMRVKKLFLF